MSGNEQLEAAHHADNQRRMQDIEGSMQRITLLVERLASAVGTIEGSMVSNTTMTQAALDGLGALKLQIGQLDIEGIKEIVGAVDKMKGGITVLGWIERPAKWFAVIAGAAAAGLALWVKWKTK